MNTLRQSQKRARQLNNARNRYGAHKPRVWRKYNLISSMSSVTLFTTVFNTTLWNRSPLQVCVLVAVGPGANLTKIASDIVTDVRASHAAVSPRPPVQRSMRQSRAIPPLAERRNEVANGHRASAAAQPTSHHTLRREVSHHRHVKASPRLASHLSPS